MCWKIKKYIYVKAPGTWPILNYHSIQNFDFRKGPDLVIFFCLRRVHMGRTNDWLNAFVKG